MSKTILVAEDSSVIINLTKRVITNAGEFEVESVRNGKEVLEFLEQSSVDLVILDLNMPVLSGEECIKSIRNHSDNEIKNLPVFALTGNASNYSEEEFKTMGFSSYIPKPIDFDFLVKKIVDTLA